MKIFLGTNFGHAASTAIIDADGALLYAIEEGRIVGQKEYSGFPNMALSLISYHFGPQVACWHEGWHRSRRLLFKGLGASARYAWRDQTYLKERLVRELRRSALGRSSYRRWMKCFGRVRFVGHHEAHALSLLPWGLPEDSVVVVSDYIGERWSLSCFHWSRLGMRCLGRVPFPHSLGAAYQQLATHLGFFGNTGPGKVMALAAHGEPRWARLLHDLVRLQGTSLRIDQRRFPLWLRRRAWAELGMRVGGEVLEEIRAAKGDWEQGRDLAASAQEWLTETTWRYIGACVRQARTLLSTKVSALGLAGGCALNCQANGEFVRRLGELGIDRVVVSPWSDDSGTAIGAAAHGALSQTGGIKFRVASAFVGPEVCNGSLTISTEALGAAVRALAEGGVVALGTGRLEFGPRALGGRCLLADPRRAEMRKRLNAIKGRPGFMPFAPAVLAECYARYFVGEGSTNMAWTVRIRPEVRAAFPGLDHASGQARVQVVSSEGPTVLRRLLCEWERQSGTGMLLLTSLNGSGEAIPDTAERCANVASRLGVSGLLLDQGWQAFS